MSKASEYARRLAAADEARVEDIVIGSLGVGVTHKGDLYIKSSCANSFPPADALRLRDWITENFGEENE